MPEYPVGHHPNSKKNLIPFKNGADARRKHGGPPNAGRAITTYFNELCAVDDDDTAKYDLKALRSIAGNPKAPHPKAIAATLLLAARAKGFDKLDRQPKSLAAIREMLDRLLGKPKVQIEVAHTEGRTPQVILADITEMLASCFGFDQWRALLSVVVRNRPEFAEILREVADHAPVDEPVAALPDATDVAIDNVRQAGGSRP